MKFSVIFGCILLLAIPTLVLADIEIIVAEEGKVINYYEEFYVYQLNGTVNITNPTNETLYNIEIPFFISTLSILINETSGIDYITNNQMFVHALDGGQTHTFYYRIVGISSENMVSGGRSILGQAILARDPKIYSKLMGSLLKAPIEEENITGNANTRLISVHLDNPTDFTYTVDKIDVIKTSQMDPNVELNKWSFASQKPSLDSYENWKFDFLDENAVEGEIYWLSTDIYIDAVSVISRGNITHFNQDELFEIYSNDTLNVSINSSLGFLADRVYLRKFSSASVVNPGEVVDITLVVNNLEPHNINVVLDDSIPRGFEVVSVEEGVIDRNNVSWSIPIARDSVKRITYSLRYVDDDVLGLDYFPAAVLSYDGKKFYSQTVPFVRKYVPEKKVFVQKNVRFLGGDEVQITLSLQNLGESTLENIVLKEHLLSSAEFREISIAPQERGVWLINTINSTSPWVVSYITDRGSVLNTMPEVYGVPQSSVLQTIVLSNLISSSFSIIPTSIVEIVALVILGIILILYFVPSSYFSRQRRTQAKDLSLLSGEIDSLRKNTQVRQPLPPTGHPHHSQQQAHSQDQSVAHRSSLHSPQRQQRHQAVDKTSELLEKSKKEILGQDKNEGVKAPKPDESGEKKD